MLPMINDQALGETGSERTDGLGFKSYAQVFADVAAATDGPFTIGIFGEWGTGKTSLLRLTETYLQRNDGVVTVWFNAWKYEQEEHPIIPLVGTIVRAIESNSKVSATLGEVAKALRAVAYGFSVKNKVGITGFLESEVSFSGKEMIDRQDELLSETLLEQSLYHGAFDALETAAKSSKAKVVIFVDDLDRCFPEKSVKLLEGIKLILSQPGFIFVLGVARSVIEGYLDHKYISQFGLKDFKGGQYLDKIVQLPFQMPTHENRIDSFTQSILEHFKDYPEANKNDLPEVIRVIYASCGHNPRSAIRFINNAILDQAICEQADDIESPPRIEMFAVTRLLQEIWPTEFHLLLSSGQDVCRQLAISIEHVSDDAGGLAEDAPVSMLREAIQKDSSLTKLMETKAAMDWLRDADSRKVAIEFLQDRNELSESRKTVYIESSSRDTLFANKIAKAINGFYEHECVPLSSVPPQKLDRLINKDCVILHLFSKAYLEQIRNDPLPPTSKFIDEYIKRNLELQGSKEVVANSALKLVSLRDSSINTDDIFDARKEWA